MKQVSGQEDQGARDRRTWPSSHPQAQRLEVRPALAVENADYAVENCPAAPQGGGGMDDLRVQRGDVAQPGVVQSGLALRPGDQERPRSVPVDAEPPLISVERAGTGDRRLGPDP